MQYSTLPQKQELIKKKIARPYSNIGTMWTTIENLKSETTEKMHARKTLDLKILNSLVNKNTNLVLQRILKN